MYNKGFTLMETIISLVILAAITLIIMPLTYETTHMVYTSQIEVQERNDISYYIFYLTREIQSAEKIKISDKELQIMQTGDNDYTLKYCIKENGEFDELYLNDKKLAVVDYDKCFFKTNDKCITVALAVPENNIDYGSIQRMITFSVFPRKDKVIVQEE